MSFEFEYKPSGGAQTKPGGGRLRRGPARRRGGAVWVLWLCAALLGAGVSVAMAAAAGEVRAIGDGGFWRAMAGILAVLFLSLPGFSMYWHATREQHNWLERRWRPTAIVGLSLASSVGAALWCGYLIAVRIAREWPV